MKRIKQHEKYIRHLIEHIHDIVTVVDTEGKILFESPSVKKVLGYEVGELAGTSMFSLVHPDDLENARLFFQKYVMVPGEAPIIELRYLHKFGEWRNLEVRSSNLMNDPDFDGIILTSRDVTESKKAIEKLAASEAEVLQSLKNEKEVNKMKSGLINMVSHDIRTPLAIILSSTELIEIKHKSAVEENGTDKYFQRIKSEIKKMTNLLDNVLNAGRIDNGDIDFRPDKINPATYLEHIVRQFFSPCIDGRHLNFTVKGKPKPYMLDADLFQQICLNMLSNAFKYSAGKKRPSMRLTFDKKEFHLEVEDYGMGIPEAEQHSILKSFYRASNTDGIKGTGLGLYIINQLVEIHKGKLVFSSVLNKGTVFKVTIPEMEK